MTCSNCGAPLPAGAMFCGECGAKVARTTAFVKPAQAVAPAPPAPPPPAPPSPAPPAAAPPGPLSLVSDTITIPPGLLSPASAVVPPPVAGSADIDETVIVARRGPVWGIVAQDGTRHAITAPTVIGRSPVLPPGRTGLTLLALADPTKTLSKTHAILVPDGDRFTIEDLGSTNGVIVTTREGAVTSAGAGVITRLDVGSIVEFGDCILVVERS